MSSTSPSDKKIRALWLFAHELGIVRDPSERALAAYVKRLAGVDVLQRTDGDQVLKLIESLKMWIMRYLPRKVHAQASVVLALPLADYERSDLQARLMISADHMTYDPMIEAQVAEHQAVDEQEALQDAAKFARRVRKRLGLSQSQFSERINVSLDTIRNWEQGKRYSTGAAKALLTVLDRAPEAALEALS